MTEVPEHLLRRSRERREALGLDAGGGGEGAASPPAEAPAAAPAGSSVPATTAAAEVAAPAAAAVAPVVVEEPPAEPAYIRLNEKRRSKNPIWVMPVLVGLPLWAFFYAFAFSPPKKAGPVDPVVLGAQVFRGSCASCHGAAGEGGTGPKLAGGEAKLTFPDINDHISWVKTGSGSFTGQKYGDPNREGGQHGPAKGIMPSFSSLPDASIRAVVQYEREKL
jgi:mono/diheme cytochrome c family protein